MKYYKNLTIVAFIILGLLSAPAIYAADKTDAKGKECSASQDKCGKAGDKHQKMWDELNLTPDQKKQLEDNKAKNREIMKATFEKMKFCRESLREELMKPALDMDKINSIQSQIKALEAQMTDNRLNSILGVRKILTCEQFEKFIQLIGKHKHWHREGEKAAGK